MQRCAFLFLKEAEQEAKVTEVQACSCRFHAGFRDYIYTKARASSGF